MQTSTLPGDAKPSYQKNTNAISHYNDNGSSSSTLISKNVTIGSKRTSIRLEDEMWKALKDISRREKCSINEICTFVYLCKKPLSSLTASIRVFLLLYYKAAATEDGHMRAGHGHMQKLKLKLLKMAA